MGVYLNGGNDLFLRARNSAIYVDKSGIIGFLNSVFNTEKEFVCVSRPRRFGKSMTANMISAFYDRSCNAAADFQGLKILNTSDWARYANQYDVIHINMQNFLSESNSVNEMIDRLSRAILHDLLREYKNVDYYDKKSLFSCMNDIYAEERRLFVIVIDEWDCIFREYKKDENGQKKYLDFLRTWLKDRAYVGLCYMTGILPIKKYGTHSALNMFSEFSMEDPGPLAQYVGFTENEVQNLCNVYGIDMDECRQWYDGYSFSNCDHIYNPNSIVSLMTSGIFDDYWNKTETYEALKIYIDMNYDGLRDAVIAMMAGDHKAISTGSFQNDMTTFSNADDVMTLLVHLGYLGYRFDKKEVFIPNQEILTEFITATTVSQWNEVVDSVLESKQLLNDTWNKKADKVAYGIEKAHLETSHIQYNDVNALSYTISLAYYAAREYYTMIREFPSGNGFADIAFIPRRKYADKPAMIVELKWNQSADTAIAQIHQKKYPHALQEYSGNILLVGISYNRKTKKHSCKIETAVHDVR